MATAGALPHVGCVEHWPPPPSHELPPPQLLPEQRPPHDSPHWPQLDVWQNSVCSNFWIAHNSFSNERQGAPELQPIGAQPLDLQVVGAQLGAHEATQLADSRLRSSSDSIEATGCRRSNRRRAGAWNRDLENRRSMAEPPRKEFGRGRETAGDSLQRMRGLGKNYLSRERTGGSARLSESQGKSRPHVRNACRDNARLMAATTLPREVARLVH